MIIARVSGKSRLRALLACGWLATLLPLGCYTLLALVVTFPLALHLGQSIVGNRFGAVDGFLGIWNTWWAAQALKGAHDPFFTPLLFYPDGLDLFWQTLSLPQTLLVAPLTLLAGPLVAYNILILASFVLSGYATFLFVRYITGSAAAGLIGGAIYSLAPFHMQKVLDAQLEVAATQWVPLYLLALHILLERRRWRWALLAGALLLWVGLGTWYYGLFCIIYTGMAALLWALPIDDDQRPTTGDRRLAPGLRSPVSVLAWGLAPIAIWGWCRLMPTRSTM